MINTFDNIRVVSIIKMCFSLDSGGDVDILVASDKEAKISPIREAFQQVFGKATVS